jgi:SpoVK/Ycf46/Vps4 family AAA+-type ATPase
MNQLQRNDAALNKAMEAKTKAIQAADDQRKAEEEAEYWGRLAWQSQKKQERVAAWSSIGKAAIKGKQEQGALNELTGSNSSSNQTMASSDVSSFAKQYGMSEAEAQQYLQILQDNPQLVEDLAKMNK